MFGIFGGVADATTLVDLMRAEILERYAEDREVVHNVGREYLGSSFDVAERLDLPLVLTPLAGVGIGILALIFVEGTDKGETKAEPKIWTERDKFNGAASKMQEEMAKLNVAAKSGNIDIIKAAVGETGKSCKACHDAYRKE